MSLEIVSHVDRYSVSGDVLSVMTLVKGFVLKGIWSSLLEFVGNSIQVVYDGEIIGTNYVS